MSFIVFIDDLLVDDNYPLLERLDETNKLMRKITLEELQPRFNKGESWKRQGKKRGVKK